MSKLFLITLAIAFVAVVVHGGEVPAELQEAGKAARAACMEETGATEEMIEDTLKGEFTDDEKFKCYFKCTMEKFELTKDDDINYDAILEVVPEANKEMAAGMLEKCRETTGEDLCEKANNLHKCFYEHNPEQYFVV